MDKVASGVNYEMKDLLATASEEKKLSTTIEIFIATAKTAHFQNTLNMDYHDEINHDVCPEGQAYQDLLEDIKAAIARFKSRIPAPSADTSTD